jgi:multicomponent K+:H+ antiporter subunit E
MARLLPFPLASASLLVLWLLLNQTLSVGQFLIGCAAGLAGGWMLTRLQLPKGRVRRPGAIVRLLGVVLVDIVRSNIAVGRIILGLGRPQRTPGFVNIPLALHDPYGLTALACIITSTPGTLWVDFDARQRVLRIHVLDLVDEGDWIRIIKGRYEPQLLEIFQ